MRRAVTILFCLFPTVASAAVGLSDFVEFTGEAVGDSAGTYVASGGDVNGDGYDDFVIGAPSNSAGSAYLVYGQSSKLSSASLSTAIQFSGETNNDEAGISIVIVGDVNGDGYDDIVVGAHRVSSSAGAAYLIYGQASQLTSANLSTAIRFTGATAGDRAGYAVDGAGDVNNDGYDDFLIGALGEDTGGSAAGAAYLVYGQATTLTAASLSTKAKFYGEAASDNAGFALAGAGDVNNDGYDDFLVGAYANNDAGADAGAVYLIYGQSSSFTGSASLGTAVEFTGEVAGDQAGNPVDGAGDVNGDGYDDLLIGAAISSDGASAAGAAYLVYGQSANLSSASLSTAVEFTGVTADDQAGYPVSGAGDVNNDGYDDFLVAAINGNKVYLVTGSSSTLSSASLSTMTSFSGEVAGDATGTWIGGGDINGDSHNDILVGAIDNDDGGNDAGAVYVGYLYVDADRDGVAGTSGLLATGSDCSDSDATVSSNQTYYQDSDGDGLGSDTTTSVCSSTAPAGYVSNSNDTNDADADNDGTATSSDCNDADSTISSNQTYYQDSDGDGLGSDTTTSVCSLTAPAGYAANSDDTDDTIAFSAHTVSTVTGSTDGTIIVAYNDSYSATYTIFTVTTSKTTVVALHPTEDLIVVVHPKARKIALVNALSGAIYQTKSLNDKSHSKTKLVIKDLRSDDSYEAVVVAKRKTKLVHVHVFTIKVAQQKLKLRDDATVKHKKILPSKTKVKNSKIQLRNNAGKVLVTYNVTKQYRLNQ